jgi:hypothetical protein
MHDVGVVQLGDGQSLVCEAIDLSLLRKRAPSQNLNGDDPAEASLPRAVDDAHSPASDFLSKLIIAESGSIRLRLTDRVADYQVR